MVLFVMFLIGVAMIVAPFVLEGRLTPGQFGGLMIGGVVVTLVAAIGVMITKLYRKASANMAFVRTGMGGAVVVRDAGRIVAPVVHQVVPVSLETMKLEVERMGQDALITQDNLRVDVKAEFYIRVNPTEEDILQAARSLGYRAVEPERVAELVREKLAAALHSTAGEWDLAALERNRTGFAAAVQE